MGLGQLARRGSSNPRKHISELRERIEDLSKGDLTESAKEELGRLRLELEHSYMDEELYWRQR